MRAGRRGGTGGAGGGIGRTWNRFRAKFTSMTSSLPGPATMAGPPKKYGLILPARPAPVRPVRPALAPAARPALAAFQVTTVADGPNETAVG